MGREDELAEIHTLLLGGAQVALDQRAATAGGLTGLGGVGKTTLACEYAHRHLDDYEILCWVNAEGQDASSEFAKLAEDPLRLEGLPAKVPQRVVAVRQALERAPGTVLLVFDNVDHAESWPDLVPVSPRVRVLVTTRLTDLDGVTRIDVDRLPPEKALELLLGSAEAAQRPPEGAVELCKELDHLTLALAVASKILAKGVRTSALAPIRVFISYSHDSDAHEQAVRDLADRLRQDGIDAWIDRYEPNPSQGWPRWMQEQVEESRFVVLVCTETFKRRFDGKEKPGTGKGATWEGLLAIQVLYDSGMINEKLIPVLLDGASDEHIPLALKPYTHYRLPAGYDDLYRHLTRVQKVLAPPLGRPNGQQSHAPTLPAFVSGAAWKPGSWHSGADQREGKQVDPAKTEGGSGNNARLRWSIQIVIMGLLAAVVLALWFGKGADQDPPEVGPLSTEGQPVLPSDLKPASGPAKVAPRAQGIGVVDGYWDRKRVGCKGEESNSSQFDIYFLKKGYSWKKDSSTEIAFNDVVVPSNKLLEGDEFRGDLRTLYSDFISVGSASNEGLVSTDVGQQELARLRALQLGSWLQGLLGGLPDVRMHRLNLGLHKAVDRSDAAAASHRAVVFIGGVRRDNALPRDILQLREELHCALTTDLAVEHWPMKPDDFHLFDWI